MELTIKLEVYTDFGFGLKQAYLVEAELAEAMGLGFNFRLGSRTGLALMSV